MCFAMRRGDARVLCGMCEGYNPMQSEHRYCALLVENENHTIPPTQQNISFAAHTHHTERSCATISLYTAQIKPISITPHLTSSHTWNRREDEEGPPVCTTTILAHELQWRQNISSSPDNTAGSFSSFSQATQRANQWTPGSPSPGSIATRYNL